jgi:thiol-disulfide isomerase/thioredoxin
MLNTHPLNSKPNPSKSASGYRYLAGAIACFTILVIGLLWLLGSEQLRVPTKPYQLSSALLPDLRDLSKPAISIGERRNRPTVVNFFFSDCPGCVTELPLFEAASKRWANKIDVIGVDHFETRKAGLGLLARTKISFPVAWDETGVLAPVAQVSAFPATLFVDRNGIVQRRILGRISASQLNRELELLFNAFRVK